MSEELPKPKLTPERMSLLYQVSNVIHSTLDSQEALQLIVSEAARVMRASSGSLVLINPSTNILEIHAAQNLSSAARRLKLRVGELRYTWRTKTTCQLWRGSFGVDRHAAAEKMIGIQPAKQKIRVRHGERPHAGLR